MRSFPKPVQLMRPIHGPTLVKLIPSLGSSLGILMEILLRRLDRLVLHHPLHRRQVGEPRSCLFECPGRY